MFFILSCGDEKEQKINTEANANDDKEGKRVETIPDAPSFLSNWKKENILIYHVIGEPDDMHPCNGLSAQRSEIMLYTQVFLLNLNYQTLEPYPQLAKALPTVSEDGLVYTFELKNNMRFDDGKTISAEDVIFTFKANKCPLTNNPHAKPFLDHIKTIEQDKSNPLIIRVSMKDRYIQNLWLYSDYPIMQRSFFDPENTLSKYSFEQFDDPKFKADANADLKKWGAFFNDAKFSHDVNFLVGAGPYKIESWDAGQSLTLLKKNNHWSNGKTGIYENAYPEKIIMKINKDHNSTKLDFKAQVFDATAYMDTKPLLELLEDPNFKANYNGKFMDTYNYTYMAFNTKPDGIKHKSFFTDAKVRRALAHLVPVDDINKVVNKNINSRSVGPVSPLKKEYNTELKPIDFNIEKAKQLLSEAGWKDTDNDQLLDKVIDGKKTQFVFAMHYMTATPSWGDMAKLISEAMMKAGIKAEITPLEFNVHYDKARNHDFDVMLAAWAGSSIPDDFTQIWHTSSWASKGSNYAGFGNAQSDALIDSIKIELNDEKRHEMVKRFQKIVYDDQPYVFLFSGKRRIAVHKRFGNQEYYFEKPGLLLNNLRILGSGAASAPSASN